MSALAWTAALLAGAAAWLAATGRVDRHRRLTRAVPGAGVAGRGGGARDPGGGPGASGVTGAPGAGGNRVDGESAGRRATAAAAVAGGAVALLVGGAGGLVAGVVVGLGVRVALGRLEPRAVRERRTALARQAPDVADLLAACLASGAPMGPAVAAVARAVGEPVAAPLRSVVATLELGGDLVDAWSALAGEPGLAPLGRAIARSLDSGAPLGDVLPGIADDLRRAARVEAETAARAAGVRAVAPLAACFLPAFLLLGVVPVVASLAGALLTGT